MRSIKTITMAISAIIALSGCGSHKLINLSPDTYMIIRQAESGFASMGALKIEVYEEASEFAAKQGKVAIPLSSREVPVSFGSPIQFEYQFRVVDKNDPEYRRTHLAPGMNVIIDKKESIKAEITTKDKNENKYDLYTELTKLDDLKKRGIISEGEFQTQKKKLLNGQ